MTAGSRESLQKLVQKPRVRAVLDTTINHRLCALWTLGLILGLRPGELTGLRWQDIDFDTGVISIRTSLKHRKGQWEGDTKTRQSRRRLQALPSP